jgi:hypothetical protein
MEDLKYMFLGSTLNICSAMSGGYFMENLKVLKQLKPQMAYISLARTQYNNLGFKCYVNGFFPWGITQAVTKGIPVILVNKKTEKKIKPYIENSYIRFGISGFVSGIAQSLCVTPTQRLKTIVWEENINVWNAIKQQNVFTLYRGLSPMAFRRGFDLSIRSSIINSNIDANTLTILEKVCLGIGTTVFSCLFSQPFDVVTARKQSRYNENYSFRKHIFNIYKKDGIKGFYRGLNLRLIDASQHTLWIFVFSNIILSRTY